MDKNPSKGKRKLEKPSQIKPNPAQAKPNHVKLNENQIKSNQILSNESQKPQSSRTQAKASRDQESSRNPAEILKASQPAPAEAEPEPGEAGQRAVHPHCTLDLGLPTGGPVGPPGEDIKRLLGKMSRNS